MKANCIEFKTTDGGKAFIVASELESLYVDEIRERSFVSLKSGAYFYVDAKTATDLIELLGLITSSTESVNTAINVEVSTSMKESSFKKMFTHPPVETPNAPYVYAANLSDELLAKWLLRLSDTILAKNDISRRIESEQENAAARLKEQIDIDTELFYSIRR
ncbi:hypothetical protein RF656_08315 [Yersinia kristensenii]|uniref:hypothetical protein n=1 Tax=Yersinia kristensenii TaxID=28152 RepID=UPI00285366B5|nr:hypothetical protein [Yersinia kristensenii]MDR4896747.1 hypothetical protein [Yersinia kristensenii]MDX6735170.1 hypothetical protein [Yersinia kristensenii]